MTIECPKCQTDNPIESKFCNKCATQLPDNEEVMYTKTLETAKEELTTGSTFAGRYQIIEELGKGGMGKVYKVLDKEINTKVALKLINPEIAMDKKTIERFRNELKTARDISHKNVCRMYDLNKEKGTYYITMEYVSGGDLKTFIRRAAPLSTARALSIGRQICEGLSEAHKIGIVHRDLKPNNIMIDDNGSARIMDFGIARSVKGKGITGSGIMIGTPEYMSPEQAEGKELDHRSDIYSLGIILYEMVTGQLPFQGDTPLSIAMKHKGEAPKDPMELNPQIPKDFSRVILKCLEKAKENRFQKVDEVLKDIENIEGGLPTTGRTIPQKKPLTSREITVTFGLKKSLIPILIVLASIIIVILTLTFLPKKETVFAPKIENSIAVISFENQTGDKAYDYLQKAIPNLLITSLEQTESIHVTTWERMRDLLKQMGKGEVETINSDSGFELCLRDGIAAIVLGSYTKAGNVFVTDVKLLDVETKNILMSASSTGEGIDSILRTQIDELSRKITQNFTSPSQKFDDVKMQISGLTTTSMEAYQSYLKGVEAGDKLYYEEAAKYLERAVTLDPEFAMAYSRLAIIYRFLGNSRAMNDAFEKMKTFSLKTTEKERLSIEGLYLLFKEENLEKAVQIFKQIVDKFPKEKMAHHSLGYIYQRMGSFDESIVEYNKVLELDPFYGMSINQLAYIYADMGDHEKAFEYFNRYASVSPGDANPIDSVAELYFRMGKLDESIQKYKEALEIKPGFGSSTAIGYIHALKENYSESIRWFEQFIEMASAPGRKVGGYLLKSFIHAWLGKYFQALDDIRTAQELAGSVGNDLLKASIEGWMAIVLIEKGDFEQSKNHLDHWFELVKNYNPQYASDYKATYLGYLGWMDLEQGQIDAAKSRLVEMELLLPDISPSEKKLTDFHFKVLQGEIKLAEGSFDQALAFLEKAIPMEIPSFISANNLVSYSVPFIQDGKARAYLQKGELDRAIAEYEQLITFKPESKDRRLIHPKYHYRLAKLYEQKGWKGKAIEHYERFLDLWKDSDPNLPEVEDAKKRLAGLKE